MENITAIIERVVFSGDNFFVIAKARTLSNKEITIKGKLVTASIGDTVDLTGNTVHHKQYGESFSFVECNVVAPKNEIGIASWLSKLPSIGEVVSRKIINKFGAANVFNVIEHDHLKLVVIKGITKKRAEEIHNAYNKIKNETKYQIELRRFRMSDYQIALVVDRFKTLESALKHIKENPYCLCEINGFGFLTADKIAINAGIKKDNIERHKNMLRYIVEQEIFKGDLFHSVKNIFRIAFNDFDADKEVLKKAIRLLEDEHVLFVDRRNEINTIALTKYVKVEEDICMHLKYLKSA